MLQLAGIQGTQIDHYRIQRLLGRGGMSEVYLAYDEHLHRKVALKLVEKGQLDYFERFQHEVAVIGSLEHDHILPVFAYGEYNDWCYLVMPYLEYGTLNDKLKAKGPLTPEETGILLEQIASALHYAHEHGILHRDVKSSNIMLRNAYYAYLADFGLAKEQGGDTGLTQPGYIMGTLEYLAPELQEPFAAATPGSDLYALGILLYEMLTGQVPFHGNTTEAICWQHLHEPVVCPSLLQPKLAPAIDQVVLRALAKDPDERFQTPQELAQAYQQAIEASQPTVKAALSLQSFHPTKQSTLWRFPSPLRVSLALVVFVLLLLSSIAVLNSNKGTTPSVVRQFSLIPKHVFKPITPPRSTSGPTPIAATTRPGATPTTLPDPTATPTTIVTPTPTALGFSVTVPLWQPQTPYNIGDRVIYDKIIYRCIQAHTSQVGWEPPKTPALWERVQVQNTGE